MRLPNGFGSVYKLQGHRRRPWVVKKTIEGRQKALGYFDTHDAALTFLLKINHEPHGLTATFADIYQPCQVRYYGEDWIYADYRSLYRSTPRFDPSDKQ